MKNIYRWFLYTIVAFLMSSCNRTASTEQDANHEQDLIIANDLSNQKVSVIAEDAQGHIWLGTFRGANKYNVHEYHQYFCTDDSTSLPDNQLNDIMRDSKGQLWLSTVNGLCLYTDHDNFKRIPQNYPNRNGIQLLEDKGGHILVNSMHQLAVYNDKTDTLQLVIGNFDPEHTFNQHCFIDSNNKLWSVNPFYIRCYDTSTFRLEFSVKIPFHASYSFMQSNGTLWLAGEHRFILFDTFQRTFKEAPLSICKEQRFLQADIDCIHPYNANSLLISAGKQGLFLYNTLDGQLIHQDEKGFPFEAPKFKISCMFTDSQNNLWFGSIDQGYTVRYSYKERFSTNSYLNQYLRQKSVNSLAVDKKRNLWLSTLMDGLFVYNIDNHEIKPVPLIGSAATGLDKMDISRVFVDSHNNIWLGSLASSKVLKGHYSNGTLNIETVFNVFMPMSFAEDEQGTIWVGSCSPQLYAIEPNHNKCSTVPLEIATSTFISGLLPVGNNELWVTAFMRPIMKLNTLTRKITKVPIREDDWKKCISRSVFIPTAIFRDSSGKIWFGTVSNGLLKYTPENKRLSPVTGTPCRDISGIEEDAQGNIWVSTQYGLGKYDFTTRHFTNYYAADGIGGNQFYDRSSCRLPDGTLVFGGTHGITFFNPIDVSSRRNVPLIFEDLKIHNQLVRPTAGGTIERQLSCKPEVHLKHDQNGFSISFAALDYCEHTRVHYYYKMEGFDKYWIDAHNNREVHYANLPAGTYTFKVRITNNDQSIVESEISLKVVISPAPWLSWWAWLLYALVTGSLIGIFLRSRNKIKQEKEAHRHAEMAREQEQRINKMNMSFFANVSHEFRTPLTMITGPVSMLCESSSISGSNKQLLFIVQRSVNRMLKLVNQLLDFNKLENDTLRLQVRRTDVIPQLKELADVFSVNAGEKGITFKTFGLEDTFLMWLDTDKLDKIIGNLLSNAMKFTPKGGQVELSFDADSRMARFTVADTGCGIPSDQLEKVFERYYQLNSNSKGTYNYGTGIGLYYARSLATLHHGTLNAANREEGTGTVFTLQLPLEDSAYKPEERVTLQQEQSKAFPLPAPQESISQEHMTKDDNAPAQKQTLLIVDDDEDVVYYLKALFSPIYQVVYRFDADSAYKCMNENLPDIVLSDVVMPGKDGYALCRQIKEDRQLCHIPVILVTARTSTENKVEGLNTGADAYVTKPFEPTYLLALIQSLLKNREKIRNLLSTSTQTSKLDDNALSPQDKAFMTDLYKLMETELSNSELDIARMTSLLTISRTKFYYKVKGLTGESPSVFFKTYKLNRAAELLSEGHHTVSEIAYMTGFNTLSHFSTVFKKQFGVAPSDYGRQ